jgi:hypothetical protein
VASFNLAVLIFGVLKIQWIYSFGFLERVKLVLETLVLLVQTAAVGTVGIFLARFCVPWGTEVICLSLLSVIIKQRKNEVLPIYKCSSVRLAYLRPGICVTQFSITGERQKRSPATKLSRAFCMIHRLHLRGADGEQIHSQVI